MSADLERIYLGHLSGDCNRPELAQYVVAEMLEKLGANNVPVIIAAQDVPCPTYSLQVVRAAPPKSAIYEIRPDAERLFEQAELFTEQAIPVFRPIPVVR